MTLILAWLDVTETGTMHIASDSLLSDGANSWQHGIKLFRMYPTRSVCAYTGDSLYALSFIAQATAVLHETDNLTNDSAPVAPGLDARVKALCKHFEGVLAAFPSDWADSFTALMAGYDSRVNECVVYQINVSSSGGVAETRNSLLPSQVLCWGSGADAAVKHLRAHGDGSTTQVLTTLKHVIDDPAVPSVGGFPQMFTIRPDETTAVGFNCEVNGKRESTLFSIPLRFSSAMSKVRFLDADFSPGSYLRFGGVRRSP